MAKSKRKPSWRAKGKGSIRHRKGACIATVSGGAWTVKHDKRRGMVRGRSTTPSAAKRKAHAALNKCNRDYDALAAEHAYQGRHEGGFASVGFIKHLFRKETPDALAEEQLEKAKHAYEEALIAAAQERCPAAHKFAQKGADHFERSPGKSQLSSETRKMHDSAYEMSGAVHQALRRFCR